MSLSCIYMSFQAARASQPRAAPQPPPPPQQRHCCCLLRFVDQLAADDNCLARLLMAGVLLPLVVEAVSVFLNELFHFDWLRHDSSLLAVARCQHRRLQSE